MVKHLTFGASLCVVSNLGGVNARKNTKEAEMEGKKIAE